MGPVDKDCERFMIDDQRLFDLLYMIVELDVIEADMNFDFGDVYWLSHER